MIEITILNYNLNSKIYIREQVLKDGLTGKVAFDDHGDRINAEYDIINIQEFNETGIVRKKEVEVGQFVFNKGIILV
ncbi:hypothetical protein Avbf_07105 [Armadillidium vulgare]|nr:hypothetical protein Avbf_07105 [Armadillidium vulgare]